MVSPGGFVWVAAEFGGEGNLKGRLKEVWGLGKGKAEENFESPWVKAPDPKGGNLRKAIE